MPTVTEECQDPSTDLRVKAEEEKDPGPRQELPETVDEYAELIYLLRQL